MLYQSVAFFLALVIAGITAQDGTLPPENCTTESEAMDKCFQDNKCNASCPTGLFIGNEAAQENPFPVDEDPMKNPEAAKVAYQNWFDVQCGFLKKDNLQVKGLLRCLF